MSGHPQCAPPLSDPPHDVPSVPGQISWAQDSDRRPGHFMASTTSLDPFRAEINRRLSASYAKRRGLLCNSPPMPTADIDAEIFELKRQLRDGRPIASGDWLADRYELISSLGSGGFGTVWRAFDHNDQRLVAIKVLHGQYTASADRLSRFRRGVRLMRELTHPNIVRVSDNHTTDGCYHFFVMDIVDGPSMFEAVTHCLLPADAILHIVLQIGNALHYSHEKGLVHRDVSPDNILLTFVNRQFSKAYLTDFDLAMVSDSSGGTKTGSLGKFIYAAPESQDSPGTVDIRADVYSLAMTAIFAFYGQPLRMRQYEQLIRSAPAFMRQLVGCTGGIQRVLIQAIQSDPNQRFSTIGEFCEALQVSMADPLGTDLDNDEAAPFSPHSTAVGGVDDFFKKRTKSGRVDRDRVCRELAQLYQLGLEMGTADTPQQLAEVVLSGLTGGTYADIGALLLLETPTDSQEMITPNELSLIAYKGKEGVSYQKVSEHLSGIVLSSRETILARDISDDSRLLGRDQIAAMDAKSVICAPIRRGKIIYGLVHLYSTDDERKLEIEDVEFALAVCDQCAVALASIERKRISRP